MNTVGPDAQLLLHPLLPLHSLSLGDCVKFAADRLSSSNTGRRDHAIPICCGCVFFTCVSFAASLEPTGYRLSLIFSLHLLETTVFELQRSGPKG